MGVNFTAEQSRILSKISKNGQKSQFRNLEKGFLEDIRAARSKRRQKFLVSVGFSSLEVIMKKS